MTDIKCDLVVTVKNQKKLMEYSKNTFPTDPLMDRLDEYTANDAMVYAVLMIADWAFGDIPGIKEGVDSTTSIVPTVAPLKAKGIK